jgi:hypothetical protein
MIPNWDLYFKAAPEKRGGFDTIKGRLDATD